MSKLTEKLNARGFHNSSEFFGQQPYLSWSPRDTRGCMPSRFLVRRKGLNLSDAWYDYGAVSFSHFGRSDKKETFLEAQAWASEKFGIKEWARDPFGSWGDKEFVQKRTAEILAMPEKGK